MPAFATPAPISATARIEAGSIHFTAGDRADTVVEVRPRDPKRDQDVRAAGQTQVRYDNGVLTVTTPKPSPFGRTGAVDVTVALPTDSNVEMTGAWAQVLGAGRLGEVRVKTSSGDVRLETTGPVHLTAAHGSVTVDHIEGEAEIATGSGSLRLGLIDGPAVLRNSHGTTTVGVATGELRVHGGHGDIEVFHSEDSITATTAHGTIRTGDVVRGIIQLETSTGAIDIGVREGTTAWLDATSGSGQVRDTLTAPGTPNKAVDTVKVHARARHGNVTVHRAEH